MNLAMIISLQSSGLTMLGLIEGYKLEKIKRLL